jgi:hypothetical protein
MVVFVSLLSKSSIWFKNFQASPTPRDTEKVLSYMIRRVSFSVAHKFCALREPKDNTEKKAGDQMLDFVISRSYGPLSSVTNMPFSKIIYFYKVNGIVFNI